MPEEHDVNRAEWAGSRNPEVNGVAEELGVWGV